ncbi:CapA family protein [Leptolyngbya sp. ST-U4]|uniref:CapA family protein n=4 Tax=unclassified Leptolyngbya TaxID=2650499 RepID=UPI003298E1E6
MKRETRKHHRTDSFMRLAIVGLTVGVILGTVTHALLNRMQVKQRLAWGTVKQLTLTSISPGVNQAVAMFPLASPTHQLIPVSPKTDRITISAVGDLIPGSNSKGSLLPAEPGEALAQETQLLFGKIKPFLGEADITFGNFESTLTTYPYSAKNTSQRMTFAFRTPPVYAQMLKEMGFDVLNVANNHTFDFGEPGFTETIAQIEQTGMKAIGQKGKIVYTPVKGTTIAWIGFSYFSDHNSMHDLDTAAKLVQEASQNANLVIISVHAGAEGSDQTRVSDRTEYFFGENRGNILQFSRFMIDQGADVILGHGPHVPRAVELYNDRLIAYSLGNFMGYGTLSTVGALGYSMVLQIELDPQGEFISGRVLPVALDRYGIPYLDDYFQSVILVRNLTRSDFPETPLVVDEMGYLVRTDR